MVSSAHDEREPGTGTQPDEDVPSVGMDHVVHSLAEMRRIAGPYGIEDYLYTEVEFDGDVVETEEYLELFLGGWATELPFPFRLGELWEVDESLEELVKSECDELDGEDEEDSRSE